MGCAVIVPPPVLSLIVELEPWARGVMESLGYVGIALLVALENLVPPIPSEVILPLAGFFVSRGTFQFLPVVVAATVGSVVGAWVLYGVGLYLGKANVYAFVERWGHLILVREKDLDRTFVFFEEHGRKAVFLGRLLPLVRSLVSVPAGMAGMPAARFTWYTAAGSGLWNTGLVAVGWWLGQEWERVRPWIQAFEVGFVVLLALLVVGFFLLRWRRERAS